MRTVLLLGLNVNTIRAIVEREIVHEDGAQIDLQSIGNLAERDVEALGFGAINIHHKLRIVRGEAAEKAAQRAALLIARAHQTSCLLLQILQRERALIFYFKLKTAKLPESLHSRRIERHH